MPTVPNVPVRWRRFEAYRELIEELASPYDAEAPRDDHGRVLVTSEAIARITQRLSPGSASRSGIAVVLGRRPAT